MKRFVISVMVLLATAGAASAQQYGGWLTSGGSIGTDDMLLLSQWDWSLGTARSASMGGAMSALGADLSAVVMNPAGLGVYRRGQFGVSAGLGVTSIFNDLNNGAATKTRGFMDNFGFVLPLSNSSNGLVASNFGFIYNKLADYNYRLSAEFGAGGNSILDLFTLQLNGLLSNLNDNGWSGLTSEAIASSANPFQNQNILPQEWGAVLAYLTWCIDPAEDVNSNSLYRLTSIVNGASIKPELDYTSRGYVGQYDFSWGGNVNNVLYIGIAGGFQDIQQEQQFGFTERYLENNAVDPQKPSDLLRRMTYNQTSRTSGFGFNAKFGIIYRPVPAFRLAFTYHTPTVAALRKEYEASMDVEFMDGKTRYASSGSYVFTERSYSSPHRIITGAAYTIGSSLALSVDWEHVWYGSMRVYGQSEEFRNGVNGAVRNDFGAADNIRAGVEWKTSAKLALRGGFGYYSSPLTSNKLVFNSPVTTLGLNYSLGIGYAFDRDSRLDFAYVINQTRRTMTDPYYYTGEALWSDGTATGTAWGEYTEDDPLTTSAPITNTVSRRHAFILSYTYSF